MLRRFVDYLPLSNREKPPMWAVTDSVDRVEHGLDSLVPDNPNKAYDMHEVIGKVVDNADFFELKPDYAANIITGFARMAGSTIGVVANQPMV